ncbi:MAG: hypothetical protein M4579_007439 [Chaenotheca gracillima]|nr:MAG: hypothetical protein M4579_007439 [Chaenotheca gracillima]
MAHPSTQMSKPRCEPSFEDTCNTCPSTTCIKSGNSSPTPAPSSGGGTNAGAIAGGVIGAVVVIALATFLIWRFFLKGRRHSYEDEQWGAGEDQSEAATEKHDDFHARRDARASTHTVGSIASTVLTRASNIIQIAYIPGVTNRSPPSTPGLLVPPVPPLPFSNETNSTVSTPRYHQDQHFFMPDLRDSTYSGVSDKRSTMARDSVAPSLARSSVATTIYRNDAVLEPLPAQQVIRGKAAVVSVKSSGPNSPSESRSVTPPLPVLDHEKYRQKGLIYDERNPHPDPHRAPSPAFSVGSTFMNSTANTAKAVTARPVNVRKPSKPNMAAEDNASSSAPVLPRSFSTATSASAVSSHSRARRQESISMLHDVSSGSEDDDQPGARARRSLDIDSPVTAIENTPATEQSPFSDAAAAGTPAASPGPPPPRNPARAPSNNGGTPSGSSGSSSSDIPAALSNHKKLENLSAVIEGATRRASRQPTHGGLGSRNRMSGPFSDANEMTEEK